MLLGQFGQVYHALAFRSWQRLWGGSGVAELPELRYSECMDDEVVFKPSAFSNGVTETDILKANVQHHQREPH